MMHIELVPNLPTQPFAADGVQAYRALHTHSGKYPPAIILPARLVREVRTLRTPPESYLEY